MTLLPIHIIAGSIAIVTLTDRTMSCATLARVRRCPHTPDT
jgi:hypothetical protein